MAITTQGKLVTALSLLIGATAAGQAQAYDCANLKDYVDGNSYTAGDEVRHLGEAFRCEVGGWCSTGGAYEPGSGWAYSQAWADLGQCSDSGSSSSQSSSVVSSSSISSVSSSSVSFSSSSSINTGECANSWDANTAYTGGDRVTLEGVIYEAKWWTRGDDPRDSGQYGAWEAVGAGDCDGSSSSSSSVNSASSSSSSSMISSSSSSSSVVSSSSSSVSSTPVTDSCRPDGLYKTPGTDPNYCDIYNQGGREKMGEFNRRVIGYYTSWRTSGDPNTTYLAPDIPWDSLTHINYAFAHVDSDYTLSVNADVAGNAATDKTWPDYPGAGMDTTLPYTGHFNLLSKFKDQHPHVKTLVSVGGWAETGGHFDGNGDRVSDGGFYTMTTNPDGSINQQGIEAFANSAVEFIRAYGFDGVDIDYEYPTSMDDAGNPLDFDVSNNLRGGLNASYVELMRVLREKLDEAGEQDDTHYLLTIASPSSGYLLRGMETFQALKFLDYVNIMTYDLHGAWNQFVGPNAPLFDNGEDAELLTWNAYSDQYRGIGYLNTDWAYHYMRGAMQAGRINIGVPYYTRGWRGVEGGTNGLWGEAPLPDQTNCPEGTGAGATNQCGYGATGIDNLWHDVNDYGEEVGAGASPMWHAKNLEEGIYGSYLESSYGFDPSNPDEQLIGTYERHYNDVMETPWLWNEQEKVFLSTEDLQSIEAKADYVIDRGIGGIMFWELAGDYRYNRGKGEYEMGSTLTDRIAEKFKAAPAYDNQRANVAMPDQALDVSIAFTGFKLGDSNYPISPELVIHNNGGSSLPEGTTLTFDVATSTGSNIDIQGGGGFDMVVLQSGENAAGNNVGGLNYDFHRLELTLTETIEPGGSTSAKMKYYLPISTPSNWIVDIAGAEFALANEHPQLPVVEQITCDMMGISPGDYPEYDDSGYGGYSAGAEVEYQNAIYRATAWTSSAPDSNDWETVCEF